MTASCHVFSKSLLILGRNDIIHSFGKNFWLKFLGCAKPHEYSYAWRVIGVEVDHETLETFFLSVTSEVLKFVCEAKS